MKALVFNFLIFVVLFCEIRQAAISWCVCGMNHSFAIPSMSVGMFDVLTLLVRV